MCSAVKDAKFFQIQNSAVVLAFAAQENTLSFLEATMNNTFGHKYSVKATAKKM